MAVFSVHHPLCGLSFQVPPDQEVQNNAAPGGADLFAIVVFVNYCGDKQVIWPGNFLYLVHNH